MNSVKELINLYKGLRNKSLLQGDYKMKYAFVGIGSHSINNLYPVLDYLHVPLNYICCKSPSKVELIKKQTGITTTVSLGDIVNDNEIKGVFVSVSPDEHYNIARKILESGKSLFIEKPPCRSLEEIRSLAGIAKRNNVQVTMVGVQKRYSPVTGILLKKLAKSENLSYNMRYLTGLYPEGDVLLDIFIHPLDYVSFIFGRAEVCVADYVRHRCGGKTLFLMLKHEKAKGILELSTDYTWGGAVEQLTVNAQNGIYELKQMESLKFTPKPGAVLGIPLEKIVHGYNPVTVELYGRNNFVPILANNQIYTQGYFNEIKTFVDAVEGKVGKGCDSSFVSMETTFELIDKLREIL